MILIFNPDGLWTIVDHKLYQGVWISQYSLDYLPTVLTKTIDFAKIFVTDQRIDTWKLQHKELF
jgi:hypothetical protein